MKKLTFLVMIILSLTGCANMDFLVDEHNQSQRVRKMHTPYNFVGTQFPISKEYSLTALHVAKAAGSHIVAQYPECDVAIVRANNKSATISSFRKVDSGEDVIVYGFIQNVPTIVYAKTTEITRINSKDLQDKCELMYTDLSTKKGMSGSPLHNTQGEIVGVFVAIEDKKYINTKDKKKTVKSRGVFVPYQSFQIWLAKYQD